MATMHVRDGHFIIGAHPPPALLPFYNQSMKFQHGTSRGDEASPRFPSRPRSTRAFLFALLLALGFALDTAPLAAQACVSSREDVARSIYRQVLRREADPAGATSSAAALSNGATVRSVIRQMAQSQEFYASFVAGRTSTEAVHGMYRTLLGREPDAGAYAAASGEAWDATVRRLVDSQEYTDRFGDRAVPGDPVTAWDCAIPGLAIEPAVAAPILERDMCLTIAVGGAAYECGDLRMAHVLPAVRTFNKTRAPVLLYNSQHAQPHPVIGAYLSLPAGATQVQAAVVVDGHGQMGTGSWPAWPAGEERRVAMGFDALNLPTGPYGYTVQVTVLNGASTLATYTRRGTMGIVNRAGSSLGAGWWLAGMERLHFQPDSTIFWVGGDGSHRLYRAVPGVAGKWAAVHAADRPDTLYASTYGQDAGYPYSRYERRLPGGARVVFRYDGYHIGTVTRLDHHTHFEYDQAGRLGQVGVPRYPGFHGNKLWYRFYHDNGTHVARVVSPDLNNGERSAVHFAFNAGDPRLWSITDLDGRPVQFRYNASLPRVITSRVDRRNVETFYGFDAGWKLTETFLGMLGAGEDIRTRILAHETRGIGAAAVLDSINTAYDGPRGQVAACQGTWPCATLAGDVSRFWVDRWGAPRRVRDAMGAETRAVRGDARFPALTTETVSPGGLRSRAHYDARGRVDSMWVLNPLGTGGHALTTVRYDDKWDAPVRVARLAVSASGATPLVAADTMAYDPVTGNRLWQQLGTDPGRRVTYGYYPAGQQLAGMPATVLTPANVLAGLPAGDSIYYDGAGNVSSSVSPTKIRTQYFNDVLGRTWLTISPVDPANGLFRQDSVVYDVMDRVQLTVSTGPEMTFPVADPAYGVPWTTPEERLYVQNVYNAGGDLTAVRRWAVPDTAKVGVFVTGFEYDRAGRRTAEIDALGNRDETEYDPAGNVVVTRNRLGQHMVYAHDAANRLRARSFAPTPTFARGAVSMQFNNRQAQFPSWGTDPSGNATVANYYVTLPGDVETFDYDLSGSLVRAANRDAIIRRGYYPNGSIAGDTLIIATYATRDTTQHVYGLRYEYDLAGRRTALHHPGSLTPGNGWAVHNGYDPVTGALTSVTDPVGTHQFIYNIAGQKTEERYPNPVREYYGYDAEGRLRTRQLSIPWMGLLDDDTLSYDARGKLAHVNQRLGEVNNFYSGLGNLAWSRSSDNGYDYVEQGSIQDALGNTAVTQKYDYTNAEIPQRHVTRFGYATSGTGRLLAQEGSAGGGGVSLSGSQWSYDAAGNTTYGYDSRVYRGLPNSRREEHKVSYYDVAGRLRIVDMQACAWVQRSNGAMECNGMREGDGSAFEEYRYDPLGRRVLVRSRATNDYLTRTVWDGDRVLWEIRGGERDTIPRVELPAYNIGAGRVAYTFGDALDHPLAVHRFEYRDSLFAKYDTVPAELVMTPFTLYPHTNWRGDYQIGTWHTGETQRCAKVPTNPEDHEVLPGTPDYNPGIITYMPYCMAAVRWAGNYIWLDHSVRKAPPGTEGLWMGSLIHNKRDLTGNLYMRNRYYDATAGRFSQEDPIGLAGGLNAYGFAAGDPVAYSDPYGLCPLCFVVGAIIVFEVASSAYDAYDAAKTTSGWLSGNVSNSQMTVTALGALAGIGLPAGGYGRAGRGIVDGMVDARTIRFTQSDISDTFKKGGSVRGLADDLASGAVDPSSLPPIRLFERDGALFTLDNRRAAAGHLAGVPIPAVMATPAEVADEAWKFTTKNGGTSIRIRNGGGSVP